MQHKYFFIISLQKRVKGTAVLHRSDNSKYKMNYILTSWLPLGLPTNVIFINHLTSHVKLLFWIVIRKFLSHTLLKIKSVTSFIEYLFLLKFFVGINLIEETFKRSYIV